MSIVPVLAALLLFPPTGAFCMDAQPEHTGNGSFLIALTGEIQPGDVEKVARAIDADRSETFVGFTLDSPGGNLVEAERLAAGIQSTHAAVAVTKNAMCASACFLLFAAGSKKVVQPGASIGVHSASINGEETLASMGMTTAFARDLSSFHVPSDIIGQLVSTAPADMGWLTIRQLEEMGVAFTTPEPDQPAPTVGQTFASAAGSDTELPGQTASTPAAEPDQPPSPSPVAQAASATADAGPTTPQAPQAFLDGMRDRRAWEAWFASLDPTSQAGVNFWASQRSLASPETCESQRMDPNWQSACSQARIRLAGSDVRRHTEPLYKAGWNAD